MTTTLNNHLYTLSPHEYCELTGGTTIPLGVYLAHERLYNIQVSYINGYNNTVTEKGRDDLAKPYPPKPILY